MSIYPKDLRIGNYLHDPLTKELLRVIEITEHDITAYVVNREKFPLPNGWSTEPILLTPKILEKCGFRKIDERGIIHYKLSISKNNIAPHGDNVYELSGLRIAGYLDSIEISYTVNNYWAGIKIQFLHQLQNLYFALTGEEFNVEN